MVSKFCCNAVMLSGFSFLSQSLIPRVAALLDVAPISDITGVNGEDTFVRTVYAGNAIQTVQSSDSVKLLTVRGTAFPPAETGGSAAQEDGKPYYVCSSARENGHFLNN